MDQLRFDNQLAVCGLEKQLAQCCCDIMKGEDQIRFEAAQNTCAIMQNDTANTQKIIDKMTCMEMQELREKLEEAKFQNSQLVQNATIINAIRPCPVPSFPSCNPWGCNVGFEGRRFDRDCGCCDGFR